MITGVFDAGNRKRYFTKVAVILTIYNKIKPAFRCPVFICHKLEILNIRSRARKMFPIITPGQGILADFFTSSGGMDEEVIAGVDADVGDFPAIVGVKKNQITLR
jgi:hypothetical protein